MNAMYSLIKFDAQSRNPKDSRLPSHYLDITDCLYTRTYATMQLVDLRNHGKTKMYFLVKRSVKNFSIVWLIKYYYLQPFLKESKTKMRHQMSCVVKKKNKQIKWIFERFTFYRNANVRSLRFSAFCRVSPRHDSSNEWACFHCKDVLI